MAQNSEEDDTAGRWGALWKLVFILLLKIAKQKPDTETWWMGFCANGENIVGFCRLCQVPKITSHCSCERKNPVTGVKIPFRRTDCAVGFLIKAWVLFCPLKKIWKK